MSKSQRVDTYDQKPPVVIDSPRAYTAAEVRAACARAGLNQRDVARLLGVSHTSVNRRWNGALAYDADELFAIARTTGVEVGAFFPKLSSRDAGAVAQLAELRTFNPKSPTRDFAKSERETYSSANCRLSSRNLSPERLYGRSNRIKKVVSNVRQCAYPPHYVRRYAAVDPRHASPRPFRANGR